MSYTFDQLKEDVRKEAEALKIHATKEERDRLDITLLNPNHIKLCIYGLTTGDCDSKRASELIKKCAPVFIDSVSEHDQMITVSEFRTYHWSPIEFYINFPEAKNASLIAFLRGETETLEL